MNSHAVAMHSAITLPRAPSPGKFPQASDSQERWDILRPNRKAERLVSDHLAALYTLAMAQKTDSAIPTYLEPPRKSWGGSK